MKKKKKKKDKFTAYVINTNKCNNAILFIEQVKIISTQNFNHKFKKSDYYAVLKVQNSFS